MNRAELESYLAQYLDAKSFDDDALNGLQVEGKEEIRRVAVAVSACSEVFRKAAAGGADALIVHHGLLWKGEWPKPVAGVLKDRLKVMLDSEVNLFAFHLPLDAHPEVGNNAVAAREPAAVTRSRSPEPGSRYSVRASPGLHGRVFPSSGRKVCSIAMAGPFHRVTAGSRPSLDTGT